MSNSTVGIRDSKQWRNPETAGGPIILVAVDDWLAFLDRLMHGGMGTEGLGLVVDLCSDGHVSIVDRHSGVALRFTQAEWIAFMKGVRSNEFSPLVKAAA